MKKIIIIFIILIILIIFFILIKPKEIKIQEIPQGVSQDILQDIPQDNSTLDTSQTPQIPSDIPPVISF